MNYGLVHLTSTSHQFQLLKIILKKIVNKKPALILYDLNTILLDLYNLNNWSLFVNFYFIISEKKCLQVHTKINSFPNTSKELSISEPSVVESNDLIFFWKRGSLSIYIPPPLKFILSASPICTCLSSKVLIFADAFKSLISIVMSSFRFLLLFYLSIYYSFTSYFESFSLTKSFVILCVIICTLSTLF